MLSHSSSRYIMLRLKDTVLAMAKPNHCNMTCCITYRTRPDKRAAEEDNKLRTFEAQRWTGTISPVEELSSARICGCWLPATFPLTYSVHAYRCRQAH